MTNEEQTRPTCDKSKFPDGPWMTEPDRVQWQHAGYACLIALCGYVGLRAMVNANV